MARPAALAFAVLAATAHGALLAPVAGAQEGRDPASRCAIAERLLEKQPELAVAQLEKALDKPATRSCAADLLIEIASDQEAKAPPYTACDAGKDLLDKDLLAEARARYEAALTADPPAECGVAGLAAVTDAEEEQEAKDDRLTPDEAFDAAVDFVLGVAWPWPIALLLLLLLVTAFRFFLHADRVSVRASKDDEALTKRIVAAANAAGGHGPAPVKVAMATDGLPDGTAADISSLLSVPGTAPVSTLLKVVGILPTGPRLYVSSATAGGWAVLELTLRRPGSLRKKEERFALQLGPVDDAKREELLGLLGGAWLVVMLQDTRDPSPVAPDAKHAAAAHALFRAGANCQSRGDTEIARACYAAMPDELDRANAPFAWAGARLNQMLALQEEHRWREAALMADAVGAFPAGLVGDAWARTTYGEAELRDFLRRRRYMVAVARVNYAFAATRGEGLGLSADDRDAVIRKAGEAVAELRHEVAEDSEDDDAERSLKVAIRVVMLCFDVVLKRDRSIRNIGDALAPAEAAPASAKPVLGGGPYFDAACAASMLLERAKGPPPRPPDSATDLTAEALRLLALSYKATPAARKERTRKLAKEEEMLHALREAEPAAFAKAIGEEAPPEKESSTFARDLAQLVGRYL